MADPPPSCTTTCYMHAYCEPTRAKDFKHPQNKTANPNLTPANLTPLPQKRGLLSSFMSNIAMNVVGKQSLGREDIQPALVELKRKLMERNVAEEIAAQICESVARSLEGQKLSSFTGEGRRAGAFYVGNGNLFVVISINHTGRC